jgi:Skp family chaperone for outer membrane proteins
MPRSSAFLVSLSLAAGLLGPALPASAQDFFIPGQPRQSAPGPRPAPARRQAPPRVAPPQFAAPAAPLAPPDQGQDETQSLENLQPALPPEPALPPLPRGATPPAAVIGVMGVPDVMRGSTAATEVQRTINQRREKLNEDAQKEQGAWRDMQQALINDRARLSQEQIRVRERELQERITNSQREFRERGRIIQLAAQYALAQIERTLVAVIREVAESRGMNLVLHRQQVALNVNEFDITDEVTGQMNKVLPSVVIPPDGVLPPTLPATAQEGTAPRAQPASSGAAGTGAAATGAPPGKR